MERVLTKYLVSCNCSFNSDIDPFTRLTVLLPNSNIDTYMLFRDLRILAFSFPFQNYDAKVPSICLSEEVACPKDAEILQMHKIYVKQHIVKHCLFHLNAL